MDIKKLSYFVEIVKHGKVSRAANALYISQPSLSMALAKLEEEVGFKLLERADGVFKLTDSGKEFYKHTQVLLSTYENMMNDAKYIGEKGGGQLKVGITETFRPLLPILLELFLEADGFYDIKIVEDRPHQIIEKLRLQKIHFGLAPLKYLDEDMKSLWLTDSKMILIAHKSNILCDYRTINYNSIESDTIIYCSNVLPLDEVINIEHLKSKNTIESQSIETCVSMVKQGVGVGFIPELYAKNYLPDDIYLIDIENEIKGKDLYISYMKDRYFPSSIFSFVNIVKDYFASY